jgi:hypothetical protein
MEEIIIEDLIEMKEDLIIEDLKEEMMEDLIIEDLKEEMKEDLIIEGLKEEMKVVDLLEEKDILIIHPEKKLIMFKSKQKNMIIMRLKH